MSAQYKRWNDKDLEYLKSINNTIVDWEKVVNDLGRSKETIKAKLYSLGYKTLLPQNLWTTDEIELLKKYGHIKTDKELSKILTKHTINSIADKRLELGIKKSDELLGSWAKKNNIFIDCGDYYKVYDSERKYFTLIDKDIRKIIEDKYWSMNTSGYFSFSYRSKKGKYKQIYLHNIVCNNESNEYFCDHINHKRYDNRRENLRISTIKENAKNKAFNIGIIEIQPNLYACTQNRRFSYIGSFKECFNYKKKFLKDTDGEYSFLENYDIKTLTYNLYTVLSDKERYEIKQLINET